MSSLREKFNQVRRRPPLKVWIEEIDDSIYIIQKTVAEQNEFEAALRHTAKRGFDNAADILRQRMLITSCVDADGKPIWTNADINAIAEYPVSMVDAIIKKINEVNHYSDEDIAAMEKNVGKTPDGDSSGVSA